MEIKTTPYVEDDEIGLQEMSVTYVQNPDTNDDQDHYQYLKLTTVDVPGCDNEEPPFYFNMEILPFDDGTQGHWSFCDTESIVEIIRDFQKRLTTKKKDK